MTHVKLPAGYEDWVEVSVPPEGEFVKVEVIHWTPMIGGGHGGTPIEKIRYFVPPKPKPILPDVKAGAVVRWTQDSGVVHRSVKLDGPGWHDYCLGVLAFGSFHGGRGSTQHQTLKDETLLGSVNADGFTVELDGL